MEGRRKTELLDDAVFALGHCLRLLLLLGSKPDDLENLLSNELGEWCRKNRAAQEAQQQKYEAAMAEKRSETKTQTTKKRKRWPANVVPLRDVAKHDK